MQREFVTRKKTRRNITLLLFSTITVIFLSNMAWTAERTVGLLEREAGSYYGYNLFKTLPGNTFNLTDMTGRLIHAWEFEPGTRGAYYLLENGNLLLGANRQTVFEVDWDGKLLWTFDGTEEPEQYQAHHDWYKMPNGNVLIIAWEIIPYDEAIAAGRDPEGLSVLGEEWGGDLLPDAILEYNPDTNTIVWEWHSWDHIIQDFDDTLPNYGDVGAHPELIDLNYFYRSLVQRIDGVPHSDWQHFNAIDYNPELDQIAISVPVFNEIWIIDHNISTEEARGPAGDLLYRWGNPAAYRAGSNSDMQLEFEHDVQWIKPGMPGEGNLLIFNNGSYRGFSSVVEIATPVSKDGTYLVPKPGKPFAPKKPRWEYVAPTPSSDFWSPFISGAQRLANGNTVINEGDDGTFFEVTKKGDIVWKYINPVNGTTASIQGDDPGRNPVHRMHRYPPDYPGLKGKVLTPGYVIEEYPYTYYVDFKPKHCPNTMDAGEKDQVAVAVLGTAEYDVSAIDPQSIRLDGFTLTNWSIRDVGTPYKGDLCGCDDSSPDGYPDLVLEFDWQDISAGLGDLPYGEDVILTLTGYNSADSAWFMGEDCANIKVDKDKEK